MNKTAKAIKDLVEHALKTDNATAMMLIATGSAATQHGVVARLLLELRKHGFGGKNVTVEYNGNDATVSFEACRHDTGCLSQRRIVIRKPSKPDQIRGYEPTQLIVDTAIEWPLKMVAFQSIGRAPQGEKTCRFF